MPRTGRKAASDRKARTTLVALAIAFVAVQAGFRLALAVRPAIGDREFGRKLDDLRALVAAGPGRPLVLMLGSSRVATGFRPDLIEKDGTSAPIAFNFAQVGTGPQLAHLVLRRLVDAGVRPETVLVEFWPPFWASDGYLKGYVDSLNLAALDARAIRVLGSYLPRPRALYDRWLRAQLGPIFASRAAILSRVGPSWSPGFDPDRRLDHLDPLGWWSPRASVTEADRAALVDHYRRIYAPRLAGFQVRPTPDRAMADIIDLCRRERIGLSVVILPEGSAFRSLYTPAALAAIDAYVARLTRETRVIDARDWVDDADFSDGHHLLPSGATAFTARLARDVLAPALARRPGEEVIR